MNNLIVKKYVSVNSTSVQINGQTALQNDPSKNFGDFMRQIYHFYQLSYLKFFKMDAQSKLGLITANILLLNEESKRFEPEEKAIILANRSSSLNTDEKYNESIKKIPSPAMFVYTLPNITAGEICIYHNLKGENTFFIQEKFDIDFMVNYVNILFNTTLTKKAIVGWVEIDFMENYFSFLMDVECAEHQKSISVFSVDLIKQIFKY